MPGLLALWPLFLLEKSDADLVAVDTGHLTAAIDKAGRGQQQEELFELQSFDRTFDQEPCSVEEMSSTSQVRRQVPSIAIMWTLTPLAKVTRSAFRGPQDMTMPYAVAARARGGRWSSPAIALSSSTYATETSLFPHWQNLPQMFTKS